MKISTFDNRITSLPSGPGEEASNLRYTDILIQVVSGSAQKGVSFSEMKRRLDLLDVLETSKDQSKIEMSEEELRLLRGLVDAHQWPLLHKDLLALDSEIDLAIDTLVTPAVEG